MNVKTSNRRKITYQGFSNYSLKSRVTTMAIITLVCLNSLNQLIKHALFLFPYLWDDKEVYRIIHTSSDGRVTEPYRIHLVYLNKYVQFLRPVLLPSNICSHGWLFPV